MQKRLDGEELRSVMRHVPSPVTVVTAAGPSGYRGITIGSFTSTSLDPPLISFNVNRDSKIYDALTTGLRFAVHVLSDEQAFLGDRFATPEMTSSEQFDGVAFDLDDEGTPVLREALAVIFCERHAVYDAGDHSIVLGRVVDVKESEVDDLPLVYYDRSYRRVGNEAQPTLFDPIVDESA